MIWKSSFLIGKSWFQNGESGVGVEAEAQALLRELASPAIPGERVCAAISRAARRGGLSAARAGKLWYGNARAILAAEMDQLREKAAAHAAGERNEFRVRHEAVLARLAELETELADLRCRLAGEAPAGAGGMAHP